MGELYSVTWLEPEDAEEAARVEAAAYPPEHRVGRDVIWALLMETAPDGRNCSMALYHGKQLVGFALVLLARNRGEIAEFFDAPLPAGADPQSAVLYVPEYVVAPEHRQMAILLAARFTSLVRARPDLAAMDMVGFATDEYLAMWGSRRAFFESLGWRLAAAHPYDDARLGRRMHWLDFVPQADGARARRSTTPPARGAGLTVVSLRSGDDWSAIGESWDELLARRPNPPLEQSFAFLHCWWAHAGVLDALHIVAAFRDGRLAAAVPLRIETARAFGTAYRRLARLAPPSRTTIPIALAAPGDVEAIEAVAAHVATERGLWDGIALLDGHADDAFGAALHRALRHAGHFATRHRGRRPARTEMRANAVEPALAETAAAEETRLAAQGELTFTVCATSATLMPAMHRYAELEEAAVYAPLAATNSSASLSFLRALALDGDAPRLRCVLLTVDGRDVAGVLGVIHARRLWVVHHVHLPPATHAAQLAALLRQLRAAAAAGECDAVVAGADLTTAPGAACAQDAVADLYATRKSARGAWLHLLHAIAKPLIWTRRRVAHA